MEKIEIIFEDDWLLVLNKPPGMTTTSENSRVRSVEDWLFENRKNGLKRNGIVHRLDKGTSGILLVAKTEEAMRGLLDQIKKREVVKEYLALAQGECPFEGEICMPIGRSKYFFGKYAVNEEGKEAKSKFWLEKRLTKEGKSYSLIRVRIYTGRTHQIRVHMRYLGWPLVGDRTYGGEVLGLDRPFLHASRVVFSHPANGGRMEFKTEPSDDLLIFLELFDEAKR